MMYPSLLNSCSLVLPTMFCEFCEIFYNNGEEECTVCDTLRLVPDHQAPLDMQLDRNAEILDEIKENDKNNNNFERGLRRHHRNVANNNQLRLI